MTAISNRQRAVSLLTIGIVCLVAATVLIVSGPVIAQEGTTTPAPEPQVIDGGSPLHPTFALLDHQGQNVLDSGGPVSAMQPCGASHDTAFITANSLHADVG